MLRNFSNTFRLATLAARPLFARNTAVLNASVLNIRPTFALANNVRFFGDDSGPERRTRRPTASHVTEKGPRETGSVKWFDVARGYGFITRASGEDIFVHFTGISNDGFRTLEEGQTVEFAVGKGHKGPVACDVVASGGGSSEPTN